MKEFKSRKIIRKRKSKFKVIIFTFFFFFSYIFILKYLRDNQLKNKILNEDVNYIKFNVARESEEVLDNIINNPVSLLNDNIKKVGNVTKSDNKKSNNSDVKTNTVSSSALDSPPIIYVYNTHQTESYNGYDVYSAANYLTSKLNNSEYKASLEEKSMKVFLENNNLKYYKSYTASKTYLNEEMMQNPNLKYFFDIHRDSAGKNITTTSYQNKSYAKILFVVGTDNPNYEKNKVNAERLNNIVKEIIPTISRNVAFHGGKGYNGVYNQDLSENVFLVEVGGKDNTKEEVENTIEVLNNAIIKYIRETIW